MININCFLKCFFQQLKLEKKMVQMPINLII